MKLTNIKSMAMAAALGLAVPVTAFAGDKGEDHMFKAMDADSDGKISPDESAAGAKEMFARMDSDKDGFVNKAEMAAGHAKMMKKDTTK